MAKAKVEEKVLKQVIEAVMVIAEENGVDQEALIGGIAESPSDDSESLEDTLAEMELAELKELAVELEIKTKGKKADALRKEILKKDADEVLALLGEPAEAGEEEEGEASGDYDKDEIVAFIKDLEDNDEVKEIAKEAGVTTARRQVKSIKDDLIKDWEATAEVLEKLGYFDDGEGSEEGEEDEAGEEAEAGEEGMSEEEIEETLMEQDKDDLVAICADCEVKLTVKDKKSVEGIVAKLMKAVKAGDITEEDLFGSEEGEEDEEGEEGEEEGYTQEELEEFMTENLELAELKKVAKALDVKVLAKDKEEKIISKIFDANEADDVFNALDELGFIEGNEE